MHLCEMDSIIYAETNYYQLVAVTTQAVFEELVLLGKDP